jgi:uncharacterized membrane protein
MNSQRFALRRSGSRPPAHMTHHVRFHALQSILLFGAVTLCDLAFIGLTSLDGIPPGAAAPPSVAGPFDAVILLAATCAVVLNIAAAIAWVTGMVMAWQGRWYELPVVGGRSKAIAGDTGAQDGECTA